MFVSWIYNKLLRMMFRTPFRDVSTGLRMVRRSILDDIWLEARSPFIGAELAIKAMIPTGRSGLHRQLGQRSCARHRPHTKRASRDAK